MNPSLENIKDLSLTGDNADGGSLTVEQALANLESADLGLRFYAAWWLGRFRISEPAAVTALIKALEDEADRTPEGGYPLRRNAARALGKLGDRQAVSPLIKCLDCSDFYVREAAVQSLEMLGDPVCIPALIKLLAVGLQGEQLISKQPDLSQPYDAILEALGTLRATEFAPLVKAFLEHPIELVQYSAARAMYQLTQEPVYGERLVQALAGEKLQLRRAVLADLGAIGYLPAADAIAQTLAENSLKLISLKGLLEHQVNHITPSTFSEGAIKVMNLMDSLL
ncbi:cpcE, phycocyanobilin lyase subunit alpha [Nostoc flagelliforme CCNUN1]|uniref:CpcE, phycocyanobilin lyase subunit alpha n=1 Tax=Nostoc flagelliforme CCNUN1 TaxID=2038116 RepID=A0A2K8SJV0_9NOSO|nr:HEAT repeat domain-containing protein [Nostoc flagelliforme]AUB35620.1 cpcE, phycocyanobilin lyase subunit alpha [Nostoc flagelliforme CCNUN1]